MSVEAQRRQKRLGQYFTPRPVGRLLAALAVAADAESIVDPMVGAGDLLAACVELGARPAELLGVDLDPEAVAQAHEAIAGAEAALAAGDAFAFQFNPDGYDLVITNPPYIRRETNRVDLLGLSLPSAVSIRANLLQQITRQQHLGPQLRQLLSDAARTYPATSDVAVPAWILCAALVREGGTLAMVVPQVWLTREYAAGIRALLDRAFDIQFVVEDGDATWFPDAQVRTHLLVAHRRTPRRSESGRTILARATSELFQGDHLVGTLPDERAIFDHLAQIQGEADEAVTTGLVARRVQHHPALRVVNRPSMPERTVTLQDLGWKVGQGLRTGANDFFYCDVVDGMVHVAPRWNCAPFVAPAEVLAPVVRKQADLSDSYTIDARDLTGRFVNLRKWFTREDLSRLAGPSDDARILPPEMSQWIEQVARTPLKASAPEKTFPSLTAVAPNVRTDNQGRIYSSWYQIPSLSPRHVPALFMQRVCGRRPRAWANPERIAVDANFATLWPVGTAAASEQAVLALLNSTWVWENLERICTVLGGGALKVEATDLRTLSFPAFTESDLARLDALGCELVAGNDVVATLDEIDHLVARACGDGAPGAGVANLKARAEASLGNRARRPQLKAKLRTG